MANLNSSEVLKRIASVINTNQDNELAECLGVASQTIATWKKRNKIPFEQVVEVASKYEVSVDYLLFGMDRSQTIKGSEIDSRLMEQVIFKFKKEFPQYFKHPETAATLKIIPLIYNNVSSLDDTVNRLSTIEQVVKIYKAGLLDDFAKSASNLANQATSVEGKEGLQELASDTQVTQRIEGSNLEIAGRDINKGKN